MALGEQFSPEVQAILDRVRRGDDVEHPSWVSPQKQSPEGSRRRDQIEQERNLVLALLERSTYQTDPSMRAEAERRVITRMTLGWMGSGTQVTSKRKYHSPINRGGPIAVIQADPVEQVIMAALSVTTPTRQYGVSSRMLVFTTSANGWSRDAERVWLSGLSPLIDDVGQYYAEWRRAWDGHLGGRFFEENHTVFDADGRRPLLRIEDDPRFR